MNITVLGAGYVGTVTAACLAAQGHAVTILEDSSARLQLLAEGSVPFHEPDLSELFSSVWARGDLG